MDLFREDLIVDLSDVFYGNLRGCGDGRDVILGGWGRFGEVGWYLSMGIGWYFLASLSSFGTVAGWVGVIASRSNSRKPALVRKE